MQALKMLQIKRSPLSQDEKCMKNHASVSAETQEISVVYSTSDKDFAVGGNMNFWMTSQNPLLILYLWLKLKTDVGN